MVKNKRGWLRILEATIAIMIVASVMVVVYTKNSDDVSHEVYFYDLQKQILTEIALTNSLRIDVLTENIASIDNFVASKIPNGIGYVVKICNLTDPVTPCKMDNVTFIATLDKEIFTEDVVISADLGDGFSGSIYDPKKVKLFVWDDS